MKIKYSELEDKYKGGMLSDLHNENDEINFYKGSFDSYEEISTDCDGIVIEGDLIIKNSALYLDDPRSFTVTGDVEVKDLIAGDCHINFKSKVTVHNFCADYGNNGSLLINELIAKLCIFDDDHHTEIGQTNIELCIGYAGYKSVKKQFNYDELSNFFEKNHPELFDNFFGSVSYPEPIYSNIVESSNKLISILETMKQ